MFLHKICILDWSDWSNWSECSASCDLGTRIRRRTCPRGARCPGNGLERNDCCLRFCPNSPGARFALLGKFTFTLFAIILLSYSVKENKKIHGDE